MTNPPPASRPRLASLPLAGICAVLLIVLIAIAVLRPGLRPVAAVGSEPTPTPIASAAGAPAAASLAASPRPEATPSPSPKPSPPPTAPPAASADAATTLACRATDLSGRILAWDGAAGSRVAEVAVQNNGTVACTVAEPTAIRLVAADGTVLIDSATIAGTPPIAPAGAAITVAAGSAIKTDVRVANYCGDAPSGPIGVSLAIPEPRGTVVAMPGTAVSSADAIPPCNGPIGPEIEMNGWRR
jgi:uncharacterized protein DUF4232